jgi:hypothetical protein
VFLGWTELKVKLQKKTLKLAEAQETIEALKQSHKSTKTALEQAQRKSHVLGLKLKSIGSPLKPRSAVQRSISVDLSR